MLSEKKTKEIFLKTKALLHGHFILSSGLRSPQYLQCAKLLMHPKKSELICKSLSQKIKKVFKKIDLVVAPAMGGIIVGYEVARHLKVPSIFTERVSGKFELRRGFHITPGARVLIVEDVQRLEWTDELRKVVPEDLQKYIQIFDLRHIKGRYDDIVFVLTSRLYFNETLVSLK